MRGVDDLTEIKEKLAANEFLEVREKGLLYQNEIHRGQSTINEVREKCGLSPVEGGGIRLKKCD